MAGMTLDDITSAADAKYGPFEVEGVPGGSVTLVNPLRLHKDKRKKLNELQAKQENTDDQADLFRDMLKLVAKTPADAARLIEALGDDLAKYAVVLTSYGEAARLGEASPSPS